MQLVIGLRFHTSAIKDVDHDELRLALLIEFRQPGAHAPRQPLRPPFLRPSSSHPQRVFITSSLWTTWRWCARWKHGAFFWQRDRLRWLRAGRHESRHRQAPLFVSSTSNFNIFSCGCFRTAHWQNCWCTSGDAEARSEVVDVSCDADRCVRFGSPNSDGLTGPVHWQTVRYSSADVPATIQRQAPTIKTVQGAVDVCQFQCLDRVVNVLVAIREERSIARMCCSSRVPKEHSGSPCCVATTSACDSEGQKTVDVPQVQYKKEPDLDDYFHRREHSNQLSSSREPKRPSAGPAHWRDHQRPSASVSWADRGSRAAHSTGVGSAARCTTDRRCVWKMLERFS